MIDSDVSIDIKDLTRYYKGNHIPALDQVSLQVRKGDIFGLLGPNGAGKTTMIRILCGLLSPTNGEVTIEGYSLKNEKAFIRKIIGVVPQDIALYSSLTARENLSVYGGICGLKGRFLKERIKELLPVFGLEKSADRHVEHFSGGMKRRLNLIAGLLHMPRILFLDEPTVGIDVHSRNVILENLREINRNGTTMVYTSHYLEEAENLCSYITIIDEGRIITRGTLAEIMERSGSCTSLVDVFLSLTGKTLRD
ncbi:MAG: ABC transporter ATP-binding protein [Bacteroidales bacterium]|nr:ABC transporter ATP-binding protein [Bacteroidales bacterium]